MKKSRLNIEVNRAISIVLVYALLLNDFVPFAMVVTADEYAHAGHHFSIPLEEKGSVPESSVKNTDVITEVESNDILLAPPSINATNSTGPGQAETSGFSINSTDGMVNKFTGDFSYSIPVMDVDGYPLTLSYNSNVTMLQEASWVGLGWDLNVGAVSREMRGIPDDFNGEQKVVNTFNQLAPNTVGEKDGTYFGIGVGKKTMAAGLQVTALHGEYQSDILGLGKTIDLALQGNASIAPATDEGMNLAAMFNLGFNYDSKNGIGRSYTIGATAGYGTKQRSLGANVTYGSSHQSRYGTKAQSIGLGASANNGYGVSGEDWSLGKTTQASGSVTSSLSYGSATSLPNVRFKTAGASSNFEFNTYLKIKMANSYVKMGYIHQDYESSSQYIYSGAANTMYQPAYGYLHLGKRRNDANDGEAPIMDFNRGQEQEFSEEMKNLTFSVQTYDVFHVNAAGVSGVYRPQRKDYGTFYDTDSENRFNQHSGLLDNPAYEQLSMGVILNTTAPAEIGFGIGYSTGDMKTDIESGTWASALGNVQFNSEPAGADNFDASAYFRGVGENTPVDMNAWTAMGGNAPDYYRANASFGTINIGSTMQNSSASVATINSATSSVETNASTYFNPMIGAELATSDPTFVSYNNEEDLTNVTTINRVDASIRESNKMSAMEVVGTSGMKYKYGIPVYNYSSQQVSFAVTGRPVVQDGSGNNESLVLYSTGVDNSVNNQLGRTHYYDKTSVPAYAHSFLLTEMTSPDYVDRGTPGPSLEDAGSYYKFNYTRVYDDNDPYNWRFPVSGGSIAGFAEASYSRGVLGSDQDDNGNYSYGQKEIWYTHSIETKNTVAFFYLEDRQDAYGVVDENGVLDTSDPLKLLKKIVLYNRSEWENAANPVPLQIVEFLYDYSLCQKAPGHPNTYSGSGESGKLTLKEIRWHNGNSTERALSKYEFVYSSVNPDFNYSDIDSWGQYKSNDITLPNDIFPYASQTQSVADSKAQAWKLTTIINPASGKIEIDYESDRYAFVQDKRAMRHFNVHRMMSVFEFINASNQSTWDGLTGASTNFATNFADEDAFKTNYGLSAAAFDAIVESYYWKKHGKFKAEAVPNNVVIFKLDTPISSTLSVAQATDQVKDNYFHAPSVSPNAFLSKLMFKMMVRVKEDDATAEDIFEYVTAIVDISGEYDAVTGNTFTNDDIVPIGVMPMTNTTVGYEYGYVVLDLVNTGHKKENQKFKVNKGSLVVNPLQQMALEYSRQHLLDKVYGSCDGCDPNLSLDWTAFFGNDIYEKMILDEDYVQFFDERASTIRLYEPDDVKFGGGARVKAIRYKDNWNTISQEYETTYEWNYSYKVSAGRSDESGVAAYEGLAGKDETAFYYWDTYTNIKKNFPDERKFNPTPIAEQLFPAPVIGYERVVVQFNNTSAKYGESVSTFHTFKDEKYKTKYSSIGSGSSANKSAEVHKVNWLTGEVVEQYGITQGYLVETNDFHGKPNETSVSDKNGNLISRTKYEYYDFDDQIPMVDRDGTVGLHNVATEYDVHADARYITDKTSFLLVGLSLELFYSPAVNFRFGVSPNFAMNSRERAFYAQTLVKHINRSAVVKSIQTEYLGSINTAENILYDRYTGSPVMTSLVDEYNDQLYSMNYPSHWKYREFRELNEVEGSNVSITFTTTAGDFIPQLSDPIAPGDVVTIAGVCTDCVVAQKYPAPDDGSLFIMESDGSAISPVTVGAYILTVNESNRHNILVGSMQNVVSKEPIWSSGLGAILSLSNAAANNIEVISSSANTMRDRLNILCGEGCGDGPGFSNAILAGAYYNPYEYGNRSDLVVDRVYAWQSRRNSGDVHGIRFDGTYEAFTPFYDFAGGNWHAVTSTNHPDYNASNPLQNWRKMGEVTKFDEFGKSLESKDQIGVYSAVLYSYNNEYTQLPVAQAINAKYRDIAFDGFEDYHYLDGMGLVPCSPKESHFDFKDFVVAANPTVFLNSTIRHSGLNSLQVPPNTSITVDKLIGEEPYCIATEIVDGTPNVIINDSDCACTGVFSPTANQKYIISAWVREGEEVGAATIKVAYDGTSGQTITFTATGNVIDGWQRLEGEFDLPAYSTFAPYPGNISVTLENVSGVEIVYYDDLRIHPYHAGMITTVYDPKTLLPLATHDGYNFTTFYNYDQSLNQVKVRVETENGIKTISETEAGGQK